MDIRLIFTFLTKVVMDNGIVHIHSSVPFILYVIFHLFMSISHIIILYLNTFYY